MGIVANPKTNQPALVVSDGEYVSLRSLQAETILDRLGRGYYEERANEPSRITRLPRSHTPDGVVHKGQGWGTALYTALALGAHLTSEDFFEISMYEPGDGICSWTDNRSREADRWWNAAINLGLAESETDTESETEEHVNLNLKPSDLDPFVDEGEVVYVNDVDVDVETTKEVQVELLRYESASDARHLVGAAMQATIPNDLSSAESLDFLWRAIADNADLVVEADPVSLLALDVRGLDRSAIHLLSLCFVEAGLKESDLATLHLRWEQQLDPAAPLRQGRLFPNHTGFERVIRARDAGGWEDLARLP